MKVTILVLFTWAYLINNAHATFYDEYKKFFPRDLIQLIDNPEAFTAKPDKIKNDHLYFERDKRKYALEIRKENNNIKRIHYTCTKSSACKTIDHFKDSFPTESFQLSTDKGSKYTGRFVELRLPKKGLTFRFTNNSKKALKEIIIDDLKGLNK